MRALSSALAFQFRLGGKPFLCPRATSCGYITHSWLGELFGVLKVLYVLCEVGEGEADGSWEASG